jgi:hypothetical protein
MTTAPATADDFDGWVMDNLLAVDVSVFTRTEVDHLLREDPRITARSLYYDILSAVAQGAHTLAKIGAAIGRDGNSVRHPVAVLRSAGYLHSAHDLLRQRKPTISVCDAIIRFDRLITAPTSADSNWDAQSRCGGRPPRPSAPTSSVRMSKSSPATGCTASPRTNTTGRRDSAKSAPAASRTTRDARSTTST